MKSFFNKTMLFISVPTILLILTFLLLNYYNNKFIESEISSTVTTLFIGDSHIQKSIDDKLITTAINISQSSESFYYSYYKLDKILKANPSIKRIYLGFSYHSLSSYYDEFVFGKYSKNISSRYFFILPLSEKFKLFKYNFRKLPIYIKEVYKHGIMNIFKTGNNYSFLGQYENKFENVSAVQNSMDKRLLLQFYNNNRLINFSESNISYLIKIIDLCDKNKVELITLNTPLHSYYKSKIPMEYLKKYNEIISQNRIVTINFDELVLDDSCFIPDGDHVSEKGALQTSNYFN
ncbi:MAG: hypothetical protein V3W20_08490 [Candidatus Neomarinimicrobiota bacterium]